MRESEAKYSTLIEQAKDGVAVVQDESYKFANLSMVEITGYTIQELVGKHLLDIVAPDYKNLIAQRYKLRMSGKKVPSFYEAKLQCKNGLIKDVEISAAIIKYDGKPADMLIIRDITMRKKMEEEKEKIQTQLLQAQKMEAIGLLAGGVAHDFNNLLTIILGYSNMAIMSIDQESPLSKNLKEICQAARQASNLTRQLLIFSRKQPKALTSLNLNRSINNLFKMFQRLIGEDISINVDLEPDLWMFLGDEGNMKQLIMNQ